MKDTETHFSKGQLITGIMLSILTYWLFAQAFLNIGPMVQQTYPVSPDIINISVSLTSFVTGVFMVVAGKISDRIGKVKMTKLALILSILGSLSLIVSKSYGFIIIRESGTRFFSSYYYAGDDCHDK